LETAWQPPSGSAIMAVRKQEVIRLGFTRDVASRQRTQVSDCGVRREPCMVGGRAVVGSMARDAWSSSLHRSDGLFMSSKGTPKDPRPCDAKSFESC
jgi:hypothetical protein